MKISTKKSRNIHRKTPVVEYLAHVFFVNIAKFLRTSILNDICEQLPLNPGPNL